MVADIITPTVFGGDQERLKNKISVRKTVILTKTEITLRGHTRRWEDQKSRSYMLLKTSG